MYLSLFSEALTYRDWIRVEKIYKDEPSHKRNSELCKVLQPLIPKFEKLTGQENDLKFLGYALENLLNQYKGIPCKSTRS